MTYVTSSAVEHDTPYHEVEHGSPVVQPVLFTQLAPPLVVYSEVRADTCAVGVAPSDTVSTIAASSARLHKHGNRASVRTTARRCLQPYHATHPARANVAPPGYSARPCLHARSQATPAAHGAGRARQWERRTRGHLKNKCNCAAPDLIVMPGRTASTRRPATTATRMSAILPVGRRPVTRLNNPPLLTRRRLPCPPATR